MANNQNNNKQVDVFYDLDSWLKDALGQNALAHDNLNMMKKLGFDKEVERGKAIHNLEQELRRVSSWAAANYGLYPEFRRLPNGRGTKIVFRPRGQEARDISDDDCPFLEISRTGRDGNYTLKDGMLNPNSPLLVRGMNGEVGLASALSTGVAQVLEDWKENDRLIRQKIQQNTKEGLRYLKRKVNNSMASVKQLTTGVYSTHQINEYEELNDKSINNLRPEALWAMMGHILTAQYQRQLYNANKGKAGAPTVEQFTRDVEKIMNAARGFKTPQQISNYVKSHYGWIYRNIWKGDFENVFSSFAGKMSQAGMTEGTVGKFGVTDVEAALAPLRAQGKKLKQNAQVLRQKNTYLKGKPRAATGMTSVMSKEQLRMLQQGISEGIYSDTDLYKDIYTTATLSKKSLNKGRETLKRLYKIADTASGAEEIKQKFGLDVKAFKKQYHKSLEMSLKGFGADASFMGPELAHDIRDIKDPKHLTGRTIKFDEVNTYVREAILESKKRQLEKIKNSTKEADIKKIEKLNQDIEKFSQETLNVLEKEASGKYVYKQEKVFDKFQRYIRKVYELDNTYSIDYDYTGKSGENLSNLVATRQRHNSTSVFRAGLTADERTTKSVSTNLLMAAAMLEEGYSEEEIFRDAKQKLQNGGGLRAQNFIENAPITNKNIRSRIMQILTHVNSQLRDVQKKSGKDIANYYKNDEFFKQFFGKEDSIFSIDPETGMFLTDNKALEERLAEKKEADKEFATNMLFAAVRVGQAANIYDPKKTYFGKHEVGGKTYITTENPMIFAEELGLSSSPEWMNLGQGSKSVAKIGVNELRSLEATLGDVSRYLLENGYTSGNADPKKDYDMAIKPIRDYVNGVRDQMADRKKEYDKYVKNAQYIEKTFSKDAERFQESMRADASVVKLTLDDLLEMDYNLDYDEQGGILVDNGDVRASNLVGPYLQRKREARFKQIQELKEDKEAWSKLTKEQQRQLNAITKVEDLKTFGLDLGDKTVAAMVNGQLYNTRMITLPLGEYDQGDKNTYRPDEGLKYATRILRSANDYFHPENGAAFGGDKAEEFFIRNLIEELSSYGKEIATGKTFDKYHTIESGQGSGYLLLQGMTEDSQEVLEEILGKKDANLGNVSRIMSTEDLSDLLFQELKENRDSVLGLYSALFNRGAGKKTNSQIVKSIVNKVDISRRTKDGKRAWDGTILNNLWSNRNPTINFINDLLGGGVVASSNGKLVARGRLLINKHYAAIGKGDMDGDLITLFSALNAGDFQTAGEALNSYFTHQQEYQKKIQEDEAKKDEKTLNDIKAHILEEHPELKGKEGALDNITTAADITKANSVTDKEEKRITVAASWLGKEGAGRYGNAKFIAEDIIGEVLGTEGRQRKDIGALGGRAFGAIFQTLYQKGINIKNLKRGENGELLPLDEEADRIFSQMLSTMGMSTSAGTWNDERIFRAFLQQGVELGVFDKDKMFEGAALEALGEVTKKDKKLLEELHKVAVNAKEKLIKQYGEESDEVKRIENDIAQINAVQAGNQEYYNQISFEMLNAIIMGNYEGSFRNMVKKHDGVNLGTKMTQQWQRIPGYMSSKDNLIPYLGKVYNNGGYTTDVMARFGEVLKEQKKQASTRYIPEIEQINKGHVLYHTSPSSEISRIIGSTNKHPQTDNVIERLTTEYFAATEESEKQAILQELNRYAPSFRNKEGVEDKIRGLVSHKVAELLTSDLGKKENYQAWVHGDEAYNFLLKYEPELLDNYKEQLRFAKPDKFNNDEELEAFLKKAAHKGLANTRVQEYVMGPNGKFLGAEQPLVGYSHVGSNGGYALSHQIADAMWVEEDKDGRTTLHISDLKNPESGQASLPYAIQVKDYARSMQLLRSQLEAFQKEGKTVTNAYDFFAIDNEYTRNWWDSIQHGAEQDAGVNEGEAFEKALAARVADFEKKMKVAQAGWSNVVGHIIASGDNGFINTYEVNLMDQKLQDIFDLYLQSDKPIDNFIDFNGEQANIAFNSSVKHTGTFYGGTFEGAQTIYKKELDEFKQRYDAIIEVQKALNVLKLKEASLAGEIDSPQKQVALDKLRAEIAEKETAFNEAKKVYDEEVAKLGAKTMYSEQGSMLTNAEGKSVGEGLLDQMNEYITASNQQLKAFNEQAGKEQVFENLVKHIQQYKEQSKKAAAADIAAKSPLLKGKEKSAIRQQAKIDRERERETLEVYAETIKKEKAFLQDEDGNIINPFTNEKADNTYGVLDNLDKINRRNRKQAKQEAAISDRRKVAQYEQAVLKYEEQRYSFDDQIAQKEEELDKATSSNESERIEQLTTELELLREIRELELDRAKNDLDHMAGSNAESRKKMERLAELYHKQKENKPTQSNSGNGGGGGGFLGIDAATSRWFSRLMNGGLIYSVIRTIRKGLKDITEKAKQLDQAMTNLRIVTGKNAENARTLIGQYAELGKQLGATTIEVTQSATAWLRQGYDIAQVNDLIKSSMYLSKLGMIDTATATQNLTSAMHGFKLEASDAMDIVDKFTALDVKAATTAGDIAQGLSQFANIARLGGVSIDQAAAYVATIADVNQMSGITVGQSLNFYGDLRG